VTRDLIDLMHADVAAREQSMAGAQPGAGALAVTVRRVRRTRAVRHTVQAVGVGAVAVALGGASWFGLRGHETPAPAQTPTPSVSPSAPAPSPSATAAPVALDEIPGLPPTQAMPPGLLERTTPGWVLTIYRSEPWPEEEFTESPDSSVHTVVLVSPAGDRYRVVDLPTDTAVTLLDWHAGATTAVVQVDWAGDLGSGQEPRAVLDLATGTLTPTDLGLPDADGGPFYWGVASDGAELWSVGIADEGHTTDLYRRTAAGAVQTVGHVGYPALLDPTGRWLVTASPGAEDRFTLVDVVRGGEKELGFGVPGRWCHVVGWIDAGSLLTTCADPEPDAVYPANPNATLYRVDVSGGAARASELTRFADDEPFPAMWSGAALADGRVAFATVERGGDACEAGVSLWDGDAVVPVQGAGDTAFTVSVAGGALFVAARPFCQEEGGTDLTVHDLAAGSSVLLAPHPASPAGGPEWRVGLRTWRVAGERGGAHY
jgi:hypothetical protein